MEFPRLILDTRSLCHHMLFSGKDVDSLLLGDGSTINRAEFAFGKMLERYLLPIMNEFSPISIIAVWDGGRAYRQNLYPKYKARRQEQKTKTDPLEVEQLAKLETLTKRFLAYMGAINVSVKTVEADDTIALLCKSMPGVLKRIYTLDADLLQLIDDNTVVSLRDDTYFAGDVYQGTPVDLIRLRKSLVGDTSDEYGGVPQIGEKAWLHLMNEFGVDGMHELEQCVKTRNYTLLKEAFEESQDKALGKILENTSTWELMYKLADLHPEICYGFDGKEKIQPVFYKRLPDREKILGLLEMTGNSDRYGELSKHLPQFTLVDNSNYDCFLQAFEELAHTGPVVGFDYESYDTLKHAPFTEAMPATQRAFGYVDVLSQRIVGGSFCFGSNLQHTIYVSVGHERTDNVPLEGLKTFVEVMDRESEITVCHNASFEEQLTKQNMDYLLKTPHDTLIMASYVDENEEGGLKALSLSHFGYKQTTYTEVLNGAEDMRFISGEEVMAYGCDDAFVSAHLWHLFSLILKMEGQYDFYTQNDTSTVHVLNRAKEIGIRIDYDEMKIQEADDKIVISEGMEFIKAQLTEHCSEHNIEAGRRLFELERQFLQASLRHKGKKDDEIHAKLKQIEYDYRSAAQYVPFSKVKKVKEFKPTPAIIQEVAEGLGIPSAVFAEFKNVSGAAITRLLLAMSDELPNPTEKQQQFSDLLAASAGKELKDRLGENYTKFSEFCQAVLEEACTTYEVVGDELNLDSPIQMQKLLYCKLDLPVRKRSKVQRGQLRDKLGFPGSPGTDSKAIKAAIAEDCPEGDWRRDFLKRLLKVKESMTRFELFYRPYPLWKHPVDGVIHPSIKNCGTVTRRPSGTCPNILQVSKGRPRKMFLPRYDDHVIVSPDYSGQELRLTASESRDPVLIDAYIGGGTYIDEDGMERFRVKDIHTVTACSFTLTMLQREFPVDFAKICKLLDVPLDGLMPYDTFRFLLGAKEEDIKAKYGEDFAAVQIAACINSCRYMAKIVNFLIIYGGSASTLAMNLGIRSDFAEMLMAMVFKAYSRLQPWQSEVIRYAFDHGYVKTAYGTWKHVSKDIRSKDGGLRSRAERQAVNQTIQGCAADILKIALTSAVKTHLFEETGAFLVAPVYDEITCSVPIRNLFEFCQRMRTIMNVTPPGHPVPMMAEFAIGPNWCDQTELGDNPSKRAIEATIIEYGLERYL